MKQNDEGICIYEEGDELFPAIVGVRMAPLIAMPAVQYYVAASDVVILMSVNPMIGTSLEQPNLGVINFEIHARSELTELQLVSYAVSCLVQQDMQLLVSKERAADLEFDCQLEVTVDSVASPNGLYETSGCFHIQMKQDYVDAGKQAIRTVAHALSVAEEAASAVRGTLPASKLN